MGQRTGRADLPLHGGRVPPWLATRMAKLGRVIVEAIVLHEGRDAVLSRLAHPFWFQALGCVMGMDWHSSGITTSVLGALKRGLDPVKDELGLYVCGGRGKQSRKTPAELCALGEKTGLDAAPLVDTSRLVAKVDNTAVQDGFQIYLHSMIVGADGQWAVVQQGMDGDRGEARRYHWLSDGLESFVDDPHQAIDGKSRGAIVNLADRRSRAARTACVSLVEEGPSRVLAALREVAPVEQPQLELIPHLHMPHHHDVRPKDVVERRLWASLSAADAAAPEDFESLLLVPGVGPRTLRSLAMVSEVVHGAPSRFSDPARFSLAHGGKDGHPFPVPLDVYDATIRVWKDAVDRASLGEKDKLSALERLDREARRVEASVCEGPSVTEYIAQERRDSPKYRGRTVDGWA
ncbi:MAG: DUF763 domain-containing protein [Deltaproteobacteria bacterium]